MVRLSPDSIAPIKEAFHYISQYEKVTAWIGYGVNSEFEIGEMPVDKLAPYIPKVYRNVGHPLFYLYDKEYVANDVFNKIMAPYMKEDDILVTINRSPIVKFFFPQSVLPENFQIAIKLQRSGVRIEKMREYFIEDYGSDAFGIVSGILSARRGYSKQTAYLLKMMRKDKLIKF